MIRLKASNLKNKNGNRQSDKRENKKICNN